MDRDYLIAKEWFGSTDLFDWINKRGALDKKIAQKILKQVVETIWQCFNQSVAHHDIKDENILLDPNTIEIKLIDSGGGALLENRPFRDFLGTMVYSPQEWIQALEYTLEALTVWSQGTVLYTLRFGDCPFPKPEDVEKANPDWGRMINCNDDLQVLVLQCLKVVPLQRITLSQIIQSPWLWDPTARKPYPSHMEPKAS